MSQIPENRLTVRDTDQTPALRRNRQRGQKKREVGSSQISTTSTPEPVGVPSVALISPTGNIEIKDGQFNATAGHHISVTVNSGIGGSHPTRKATKRKAKPAVQGESEGQVQHISIKSESIAEIETKTPSPIIPTERSCDIYYRHLAVKGRGSPLWIPGPNKALNIEYQRTGMRIGDVGIITSSGSFDFLFNICLPADHPTNPKKLPEGFTPLLIDSDDIQKDSEFTGESFLSSASIKKSRHDGSSSLLFESSASEGAILTMPVGSKSEDLRNMTKFRTFASLNAENWYKYVNSVRGREARNGDVRLVIGFDKTTEWGMATFSNSTEQNDSLHLAFRQVEQGGTGRTYHWEYSGMAEVRAGPAAEDVKDLRRGDPTQEGIKYENQCLFVRTLNVTLQNDTWRKLASEFGDILTDERPGSTTYPNFPSSSQNSQASSGSSTTYLSQPRSAFAGKQAGARTALEEAIPLAHASPSTQALIGHPSEVLNEMLLKLIPNGRVAITEDNDWISVMNKDDTILPETDELYARIFSSFILREEEGILFLEKRVEKTGILGSAVPQIAEIPSPSKVATELENNLEGSSKRHRIKAVRFQHKNPEIAEIPSPSKLTLELDNNLVGSGKRYVGKFKSGHLLQSKGPVCAHPYLEMSAVTWDLMDPPSSITRTHRSISSSSLDEPATDPATAFIFITSSYLPWTIKVIPSDKPYITLKDVFDIIYRSLRKNITPAEFQCLSQNSQQRSARAYEQRYRRQTNDKSYEEEKTGGMKRVDFLMGYSKFHGISNGGNRPDEWQLNVI